MDHSLDELTRQRHKTGNKTFNGGKSKDRALGGRIGKGNWKHDLYERSPSLAERISASADSPKQRGPIVFPKATSRPRNISSNGQEIYRSGKLKNDDNPLFRRLNWKKYDTLHTTRGVSPRDDTPITIKRETREEAGLIIRGAGSKTIDISNLAPGTTTNDVQVIMETLAKVVYCKARSVDNNSSVTAEITFASHTDALRAVETFDNKLADGRRIKVSIVINAPVRQETLPVAPETVYATRLYSDEIVRQGRSSRR